MVENTFLRIIIIWYALYNNFPTFSDFENKSIFSIKPIFFSETQILNILENLTISVAFYGKLFINWW